MFLLLLKCWKRMIPKREARASALNVSVINKERKKMIACRQEALPGSIRGVEETP